MADDGIKTADGEGKRYSGRNPPGRDATPHLFDGAFAAQRTSVNPPRAKAAARVLFS